MNLVTCIIMTFVCAIISAICAKDELLTTAQSALRSQGFVNYLTFLWMVWLPICGFFYALYPDWFVLYLFAAAAIPSAIVLAAFIVLGVLAVLVFALAARWVRAQARWRCWAALLGLGGLLLALFITLNRRFTEVGAFAQFQHQGLMQGWTHSALVEACAGLLPIALLAFGHVAWRTYRQHAVLARNS